MRPRHHHYCLYRPPIWLPKAGGKGRHLALVEWLVPRAEAGWTTATLIDVIQEVKGVLVRQSLPWFWRQEAILVMPGAVPPDGVCCSGTEQLVSKMKICFCRLASGYVIVLVEVGDARQLLKCSRCQASPAADPCPCTRPDLWVEICLACCAKVHAAWRMRHFQCRGGRPAW